MCVSIFVLWIVDACVGAMFFVFVFALIIAFIFTYTQIPETKGKTLEEIEHYFRSLGNLTKIFRKFFDMKLSI